MHDYKYVLYFYFCDVHRVVPFEMGKKQAIEWIHRLAVSPAVGIPAVPVANKRF